MDHVVFGKFEEIDKSDFGNMDDWLSLEEIERVKQQ